MFYFKYLLVLGFLFVFLPVNGQHVSVRGIVVDSAGGQMLEEATVRLFRGADLIGSKRSDTVFEFAKLAKGSYILVTSYQGYATDSTRFAVNMRDSIANRATGVIVLNILLKQEASALMEVVVQARIPPAIIKNDTIAFNAAAYPSPPNSTVEDMLRKLPGVEIDKDGNVTMQGQKVDKITINGKDFFLNDLRAASQNLPADLVAQVEVFDTQSERAKRLGIHETGKGKTINLKLKKKEPSGFFGKAYVGYGPNNNGPSNNGTNNSYSAGGNATRFDGSQMIFLTGNTNNINNQFTGSEHQNGAGAGLQSSNNLQLNYRDEWSKKLTATLNAGRLYNNSSVNQSTDRTTSLGDSSIEQISTSASQVKNTGYNFNGQFEFKFDSLTRMDLFSGYSSAQGQNSNSDSVIVQTIKNGSSYPSSAGTTSNSNSTNSNQINNMLDFIHQFSKRGRTIYFSVSQTGSDQQQHAGLYSLIHNFDSARTLINQQSSQQTSNNGYGVNASFTEPVGKRHILDFSYTLNHSNGHSDKESFDYDSLTGKYDIPDSLTTNRFLNHNTVQALSAGYNTTEGKYRFQIGVTGQLTQLDNLNLVTKSDLHQQQFNLIPRVSLLWEIKKEKNIFLTYTESNQLPSIDQLQPIPDLTNPYLIKTGNPDLKQQLTHSFEARYSDFNTKTFTNWQFVMNADYGQNAITSASTLLPGGIQELEYVNVQGVWHGSAYLTYGLPLGGQKNGNASFTLHGNYGHDISLVNSLKNIAENSGLGGSASINFHVRDKLFIDAKADISQTNSNYSLPGSQPNRTLNENYNLNVTWRLPLSITVASYYDLRVTGAQASIPSQSVSLWNGSISKTVARNRLEFRVSGFDLLNSASAFTQSTGVNFVQTQRTNLPGRIFLFSVIYRFRKTEGT